MIHSFWPLRTYSLPFSSARVCKREGIGAGAGLAQRVRADRVLAHARQVALLLLLRRPTQQGIVDQRVLHIDDNSRRGIDTRQLLHRQDGLEERACSAAVLLGHLDAHQAQLEELVDQRVLEHALLVHLLYVRTHALVGELADSVAKQHFIFGERDQRSGSRCECLHGGF